MSLTPNDMIELVEVLEAKAEEGLRALKDLDIKTPEYGHTLNNAVASLNFSSSIKHTLIAMKEAATSEQNKEA